MQIVALDKYWDLHDWLVWLDCDSLVMDQSVTLESVIWSALSAAEEPEGVNVIISEDGAMVNTGTPVCVSVRVQCALTQLRLLSVMALCVGCHCLQA